VLRLIGYPVVRQVLADLGRRSRRPSEIDLGWRVDVSTFHRHAPELLAVKAITRQAVPGPPRQVFYSLGPTGAELCADRRLARTPPRYRPSDQAAAAQRASGRLPSPRHREARAGTIFRADSPEKHKRVAMSEQRAQAAAFGGA
jgi:hypothetical protein